MISIKGLCEWKLIDKDSNEVVKEGSQWNLCNEVFIYRFVGGQTNTAYWFDSTYYENIQLSDSIPDPALDYRRYRQTMTFNLLSEGASSQNWDNSLRKKWVSYNFSPPGSPRTIRIIGIGFSPNTSRFISFIELSVPITQQTNQYLFVKYTTYFDFSLGGHNTPNNKFVEYGTRSMITRGGEEYFNSSYDNSKTCFRTPIISIFLPPSDVNKMMRNPFCSLSNQRPRDNYYNGDWNYLYNHTVTLLKNYEVNELVGPIGEAYCASNMLQNAANGGWMKNIYGYCPISDLAPSISRVFVHPESRIKHIFSDPSYPASSFGTISLSGTPTNKYPIVGRIKITKTGDASDIVDEIFTADAGTNELTVSQDDWAIDDTVRFTTTDTLPDPLSTGTDYYIISKSGTSPNVKIKISTSEGGSEIDITDAGTGTHTIIRQNTGRYMLEVQPWTWPNENYTPTFDSVCAQQISMGIDIDGKVMPQELTSTYDTGEGGVSWSDDPSYMLRGHGQIGDYLYTVQKSRVGGIHNICRWPLFSLETSEALCKFGSSSLVVTDVLPDGNYLYIATDSGIYQYDSTSPTTPPSLLTITGLIDTDIRLIVKDEVTGYFWTGHSTGLSKIDMTTLTATQYTAGTGGALEGLTANDVNIQRGSIDVYNGRIVRHHSPVYRAQSNTSYSKGWVMDDGVGWKDIGTYTFAAAIKPDTNNLLVFIYNSAQEISVTITGKGTGTVTVIRSWTTNYYSNNVYFTPIIRLDNNSFLFWNNTYVWGTGSFYSYSYSNLYYVPSDLPAFRNKIDLGNGVFIGLAGLTFFMKKEGYPFIYGYTGGSWVKDDTTERNIPKTDMHSLLHGISVNFNNATGKKWDEQFIATERFTFVYAPYKIKDNLQRMTWKTRGYAVEAIENNVSYTVSSPYTYEISEKSSSDFNYMDISDMAIEVKEGATEYVYELPQTVSFTQCTIDYANNLLTHGLDIPTGTPVMIIATNGMANEPVWPLRNYGIYYAIRNNSSSCKLAYTYAEALSETPIDIVNSPAQTYNTHIKVIQPTTGKYTPGTTGIIVFSSSDVSKNLTIRYTYILY